MQLLGTLVFNSRDLYMKCMASRSFVAAKAQFLLTLVFNYSSVLLFICYMHKWLLYSCIIYHMYIKRKSICPCLPSATGAYLIIYVLHTLVNKSVNMA